MIETCEGKYNYQVKDLIEDLKSYNRNAKVSACFHNENGQFQSRPIYKTVETGDHKEVSFYLGDNTEAT